MFYLHFTFREVLGSQQLRQSYFHELNPTQPPLLSTTPNKGGPFAAIDDATLTGHYPPNTFGLTLGTVHSMGLGKCMHRCDIIQSSFPSLKILWTLFSSLSPQPLAY